MTKRTLTEEERLAIAKVEADKARALYPGAIVTVAVNGETGVLGRPHVTITIIKEGNLPKDWRP